MCNSFFLITNFSKKYPCLPRATQNIVYCHRDHRSTIAIEMLPTIDAVCVNENLPCKVSDLISVKLIKSVINAVENYLSGYILQFQNVFLKKLLFLKCY